MKLENRPKSKNVIDTTNPLGWVVHMLQTLANMPQTEDEMVDQFNSARQETQTRRRDAEVYYRMKTGKDPVDEFFDLMFAGEYIPKSSSNLGDIGYFLMSQHVPHSDWVANGGTQLSLAAPPGAKGLMTRDEGKIFTRTPGPTRRR